MVVALDDNAHPVPVLVLAQVRELPVAVTQPEDAAAKRLRIRSVDDDADVLAAFAPAKVQLVTAAVFDAAVGGTGPVTQILLVRAELLAAFRARDLAEQEIELQLEVEVRLATRQRAGALARLLLAADDRAVPDVPSRRGVRRHRRSAAAASSSRNSEIA